MTRYHKRRTRAPITSQRQYSRKKNANEIFTEHRLLNPRNRMSVFWRPRAETGKGNKKTNKGPHEDVVSYSLFVLHFPRIGSHPDLEFLFQKRKIDRDEKNRFLFNLALLPLGGGFLENLFFPQSQNYCDTKCGWLYAGGRYRPSSRSSAPRSRMHARHGP